MTSDGTMCLINTLLLVSCLIFTCLCHRFPLLITRINSQPFASQIGRHFGQQSHHFQNLIWHIYHKSKIDRLIHIVTIALDTLIWTFFITYYLPIYFQLLVIIILISQALAAKIRFTLNTHDDTSKTDIDQIKCLDCETHHEYPTAIVHYISFFRLQWTWKHNFICILSSLAWIILYCSSHACLWFITFFQLPLLSVLEIMHMIIACNALFRVLGHTLEPIPPFLTDNEHFLQKTSIHVFPILVLERGQLFRLIQVTVAGYLSEYQAGLLLRFPQVFINMGISLLVKPSDGRLALRHCREQACRIRAKGWKVTNLTRKMFEASYH